MSKAVCNCFHQRVDLFASCSSRVICRIPSIRGLRDCPALIRSSARNSTAIRSSAAPRPSCMMDAIVNASFASPLANANLKVPTVGSDSGLLTAFYHGFNAWTATLTILLTLIAYDQCESPTKAVQIGLEEMLTLRSQIHMAQGLNRRPVMEDTIHRTLPRVSLPRFQCVQGEMEQWRVELRFRLP